MSDTSRNTGAWHDPIVADVRAVRQALFAAAGYDLHEFCRRLREEQVRSGHDVVTLATRTSSDEAKETREHSSGR